MMSGHSANSIFFNKKKIKTGRAGPLAPIHQITSHFYLTSALPPPSSNWTSYVYQSLGKNSSIIRH